MNIDDLSNTYSESFQAPSAKYWHTTSADLRARRCKCSLCGRHTEDDVDINLSYMSTWQPYTWTFVGTWRRAASLAEGEGRLEWIMAARFQARSGTCDRSLDSVCAGVLAAER